MDVGEVVDQDGEVAYGIGGGELGFERRERIESVCFGSHMRAVTFYGRERRRGVVRREVRPLALMKGMCLVAILRLFIAEIIDRKER